MLPEDGVTDTETDWLTDRFWRSALEMRKYSSYYRKVIVLLNIIVSDSNKLRLLVCARARVVGSFCLQRECNYWKRFSLTT